MAEILKPCSFCGEDMAHFDTDFIHDTVIYCEGCDTIFCLDDATATPEEVAEAWNRRAGHYIGDSYEDDLDSLLKEANVEVKNG